MARIMHDRISIDPAVLSGKPAVRGTRIPVEQVLRMLGKGWTHEQIIRQLPSLQVEDIHACAAYAADLLESERVYPVPAA